MERSAGNNVEVPAFIYCTITCVLCVVDAKVCKGK